MHLKLQERGCAILDCQHCVRTGWQMQGMHVLGMTLSAMTELSMDRVHAGRVRGLKGHRWLIAACETKIVMTDLVSQAFREVPRTVLDGRAPTCLAILCKCSPLLLGRPQAKAHTACMHGASYDLGLSGQTSTDSPSYPAQTFAPIPW